MVAREFVRGRFAPSPTGTLHAGNLRTALLAWLFTRSARGRFVLRMEDLDRPRVRPGAANQIERDLRWLGLDWDEGPDCGGLYGPYTQSQRQAIYESALARLRVRGLLYNCYCSRAELARVASAPQGRATEEPRYPGTCRHLTSAQRQQHEAAGRRPSLRFRVPRDPICFHDVIAGDLCSRVDEQVGDIVVRRSDGVVAYQLAVVVDDALMGISQVVRGADLLSSTARQLALADALGYVRPWQFAHVPLVLNAQGTRLAKRDLASGADALRARGLEAPDVVGALAASCGLWQHGKRATPQDVLARFDAADVARSPSTLEL